ncbi:MAG: DNA polymerase III subunit delta [Candidatus Cloacimonetes bacterium]|nr:DNA polymerase III subunit delta [Candidatus Cloacimonadota bacterium]
MKRKLKYFDLLNELNAGKIHNIYFFTEEESFLKDKAFNILQEKIISHKYEDFNLSIFYGEETNANEVFEALQTPPILSEKRLVVLRNFQELHISHKNKILNYIKHPIPESIFVIESGKVNLKTELYKKLVKDVPTYYFYHLYNAAAAIQFLQGEAKNQHKFFQNEAANLMVDYIGLSYQDLNSEFQKLLIHLGEKNKISVDDIKTCIGFSKKNNIYELQNTLAKKDIKSSLKILENLLDNSVSEVLIIIMLTGFFKTLWKISVHQKLKKQNSQEIEKTLNLGFFSKKFIPLAKRFQTNDFPEIFHILLNADQQLKSASIPRKIILEIMIYKICRNG